MAQRFRAVSPRARPPAPRLGPVVVPGGRVGPGDEQAEATRLCATGSASTRLPPRPRTALWISQSAPHPVLIGARCRGGIHEACPRRRHPRRRARDSRGARGGMPRAAARRGPRRIGRGGHGTPPARASRRAGDVRDLLAARRRDGHRAGRHADRLPAGRLREGASPICERGCGRRLRPHRWIAPLALPAGSASGREGRGLWPVDLVAWRRADVEPTRPAPALSGARRSSPSPSPAAGCSRAAGGLSSTASRRSSG